MVRMFPSRDDEIWAHLNAGLIGQFPSPRREARLAMNQIRDNR
jgi:hypothetical protein